MPYHRAGHYGESGAEARLNDFCSRLQDDGDRGQGSALLRYWLLQNRRLWCYHCACNTHVQEAIATISVPADTSEVSILNRLLRPEEPTFSPEGARDILALSFAERDKARMRELSVKAHAATLTAEDAAEAGRYALIGHLLGIMQSKARRSLERGSGSRA